MHLKKENDGALDSSVIESEMSKSGYVVILNRRGPVPLRHIVTLHSEYKEEAFRREYYEYYHELEGDEFVFCSDLQDMLDFVATIRKS